MQFTSFSFVLCFCIFFLVYWSLPVRWINIRKAYLLVGSYCAYLVWNPVFAAILVLITLVSYVGGHVKGKLGAVFILLTLLPLLGFKYITSISLLMPIGISFYTFQALGYLFDVRKGRVEAERNIVDYSLFLGFYPQLTSGPIGRARELLPQIKNLPAFDYTKATEGLKLFVWGLFLKMMIADRAGLLANTIFEFYHYYNGGTCLFGSFIYSLQLYCDFAGYSSMAIGLAMLLGIKLPVNFERPYFATSISDFWRRWHISLSSWLRDYVYIPLGGSRQGKNRTYANLLITFLISGIWHGSTLSFLVWGGLHGFFAAIEKAFRLHTLCQRGRIMKAFSICCTFLVVNFLWIIFKMPTLADSLDFIGRIVLQPGLPEKAAFESFALIVLSMSLPILWLKDYFDEGVSFGHAQVDRFRRAIGPLGHWVFYMAILLMTLLLGVMDSGQFIYVSF